MIVIVGHCQPFHAVKAYIELIEMEGLPSVQGALLKMIYIVKNNYTPTTVISS